MNTIDEEETTEDDKCWRVQQSTATTDGSDSECEVSVTIVLPTKRTETTDGVRVETKEAEEALDSPVDFWQQINDNDCSAKRHEEVVVSVSPPEDVTAAAPDSKPSEDALTSGSDSESSEDATTSDSDGESSGEATPSQSTLPAQDNYTVCPPDAEAAIVDDRKRRIEEDADSGITSSSVDVSRQASEKEMKGSKSKKYQRTCTHSRLFDFLLDDDDEGGTTDTKTSHLQSANTSVTDLLQLSSCTSGYSSAATTPSSPSGGGRGRTYESDSARLEYDSYYKSWDDACPYFGYDILPSKAFKTLTHHHQQAGSPASALVARKFKCPKIPDRENES